MHSKLYIFKFLDQIDFPVRTCNIAAFIFLTNDGVWKKNFSDFYIIKISCSSDGKESACYAGDPGSISGLGRSFGERNTTHSSTLAWRIPRI